MIITFISGICSFQNYWGWSEPAATNAPVEDEPIQPVLRMNILPARRDFFFTSSLPRNSLPPPSYLPPPTYHLPSPPPLLPTTYQPHPPSLHCQSSRVLELLWSENWSYGCGAGAGGGAGPAGVGAGSTCPRKGKMLTFFFCFFCFFCLKKAWEVFFFFLVLCCTAA